MLYNGLIHYDFHIILLDLMIPKNNYNVNLLICMFAFYNLLIRFSKSECFSKYEMGVIIGALVESSDKIKRDNLGECAVLKLSDFRK
ncbi:hypothetical protein [Clostridium estertheticum]|uniref:hypothetical protein n=1 Tax=Clostridium estertheticum TaxID=238834 RepID=UPI001C7D0536|nr:hypothetical protein [Clostridium estertheticum]MBX4262842.1 hypothetical protein [Clostridium estertheticum]